MAALAVVLVLLTLRLPAAQAPPTAPDLDAAILASGPYSRMHMLMEKTIFGFDVLTIDVRFDGPTRERFRELADGQQPSGPLIDRLARAALDAEQMWARLAFRRNVSLNQWLNGVGGSLEKAWRAGLIQEKTYRDLVENLPRWFQVIAERGFREGDQILYRGYPDRLRTLLITAGGDVLVDNIGAGDTPRRALLAGYFAPGTDTREPLIRSLLTN